MEVSKIDGGGSLFYPSPGVYNSAVFHFDKEDTELDLSNASPQQLQAWEAELTQQYSAVCKQGLKLDLTRGKPSVDQVELANALDGILEGNFIAEDGTDVRNYGGLDGLPATKALGAEILNVPAANVLVGGNSSLTLMHQAATIAHFFGLSGPDSAWSREGKVKFLCPVPGYDRHFSVCEHLGIEMITVAMSAEGPDMDTVEHLVKSDHSIKGIWCVPRFSNPTGTVYSDATVARLASLGKIAAPNFRVFWDNAYAVHALDDSAPKLASIFDLAAAAGCADSVLHFASTSKITFAGAGVSFLGASENNLKGFKQSLGFITIGPDKVNQLRHNRFFAEPGSLQAHMKKHAELLKPRFATVLMHLENAFADNDLGSWESAQGGYFVSFDTRPGLAKTVVKMAADAGVKLTPAGATYPYGKDPKDSNIRIAPSVPSVSEVDSAMQVFVLCVKLASVRQALSA